MRKRAQRGEGTAGRGRAGSGLHVGQTAVLPQHPRMASCSGSAWAPWLLSPRGTGTNGEEGHSERGTQGHLLGGWGRGRRASQRRRL